MIRVGGATEVEVKEKDRVDDAVSDPGGGRGRHRAGRRRRAARSGLMLAKLKADNDDQRFGIEIVRGARAEAGAPDRRERRLDGSVMVGKILDNEDYDYGFDAQAGEYGDLVQAGIIDPTKVVRTALQGAASVAGLLITTEAMVAEEPRKEAPPAMPGGGMDY